MVSPVKNIHEVLPYFSSMSIIPQIDKKAKTTDRMDISRFKYHDRFNCFNEKDRIRNVIVTG